jgi:hypothetical protein
MRGLSRDKHYRLFFTCKSCPQTVRVIKESKKHWRKGTWHLLEERLCQACVDHRNYRSIEDQSKKAVYDSSPNLESEEQAFRFSCHPESTSKRNIKLARKKD